MGKVWTGGDPNDPVRTAGEDRPSLSGGADRRPDPRPDPRAARMTQDERASAPIAPHTPHDTEHAPAQAAPRDMRGEPALPDLRPPQLGAIDRAIRFAYAQGVSARTLTHPFRKPARLRLLATVAEPVPGERAAGMALRAGHFLVAGKRVAIDGFTGRALTPLAAAYVHRFAWLPDLEAAGPRDRITEVAEEILRRWLLVHHEIGETPAWGVADTGHRLMNWLVHAPLLLSGGDKMFRASLLRHVAATASWLDRQTGRSLPAADAIPAWAGLTAAGLLLPEGKPRRLYAEAGLISALGDAVGEDGGMLSRRPTDQLETIVLLLRVMACYRACRMEPPPQMEAFLTMMMRALLALTHADGSLGSWQGALPVAAGRIGQLLNAANLRNRPLRDAGPWGYQRMAAGQAVVQFDSAPPPAGRTGHGQETAAACASTLAIEFSHRDQRIVVNCGGAAVVGGAVPMRIRDGLRSTAAHSTLVLHDADSTELREDGTMGAGVREVQLERDRAEAGEAMCGIHDGYLARWGLVHERQLSLAKTGLLFEGIDILTPKNRRARKGTHPFDIRFHLGPGVGVDHALHGGGMTLSLPDGSFWRFHSPDVPVAVEESLWVDADGRPQNVQQLVLSETVDGKGGAIRWSFERMK
ncbi:heparinase II/III family protein [Croceicoccus sp. YJ47]|uniref:heparinase II/III family protein n=1 Tax=Croceicoccus sp. YJ47 TaxID=2798724 RepID=UPI0019227482|nr:heparinase II/III family protein [Croceicoccus sp. YJ47]QQN72909.1 heparinase II/III family protein [Croceicoccus sp. YJ47]